MKVTGPDGVEYDFPDDAKDEEITSFFDKGNPPNASQYLKETIQNIPSSAAKVVSGLASQVGKTLTDPSNLMGPTKPIYDLYRNLTGQDTTYKDTYNYYKDRLSHPLQTLHDDPVGTGLDVLGALEGGAGAARGAGRALEAAGAAETGGRLLSTGKLASPATALGTPAMAAVKGAQPVKILSSLAKDYPAVAHMTGSMGGLLAGNLIGHPYIGMGAGTGLAEALRKLDYRPPIDPEFGLNNVKKIRVGPPEAVGKFPEMEGLPPDEFSFNPPVEDKENLNLPVKLPRGKQIFTQPKSYTIGPRMLEGLPESTESFNPPGKVNVPEGVPSGDFEFKGTGTKYTPSKEAMKGPSGKGTRPYRPSGPPTTISIDPEEPELPSNPGKVNPLTEDQTSEVIDRLTSQPLTKGQLKSKSSGRLKREAAQREKVVNSPKPPSVTSNETPESRAISEELKKAIEKDPYEIKIEEE